MQIITINSVSIGMISIARVGVGLEAAVNDHHGCVGLDLVVALVSRRSMRCLFRELRADVSVEMLCSRENIFGVVLVQNFLRYECGIFRLLRKL